MDTEPSSDGVYWATHTQAIPEDVPESVIHGSSHVKRKPKDYWVLVHEGNVVTLEGGIMHELKARNEHQPRYAHKTSI